MRSATARKSLSSGSSRWATGALLISLGISVVRLAAQTPDHVSSAEAAVAPSSDPGPDASPRPYLAPNYALEARFLPDSVNKLVFDLSVTPHWFTMSDRFWYSYRITDGTKYYIVDPVKKSKSLLWDNTKVAATLSLLTNFPYDAQHLPVKRLRLVGKDTHMRFEVEIRKDGVVPNEPEKKAQDDGSQQGNESEIKQNEDKQKEEKQTEQQSQRVARSGQAPEQPEEPRILSFEYDLASGKVTRLDNIEPLRKKPMWAAVSPDEKIVVFARGQNLYMMDADNYAKALKKPGDTAIVETQLTMDGIEKFGYARRILPEQEEELKKEDKGD